MHLFKFFKDQVTGNIRQNRTKNILLYLECITWTTFIRFSILELFWVYPD